MARKRASAHVSKGPRRQPNQSRAQATVEAIVEAAAQLLVTEGLQRSSTNRIAARAGVSIGSLYQYFDDKDAIFMELIRRHGRDVSSIIEKHLVRMDDPSADLLGALRRMMLDLVAMHEAEPELLRIMDRELAPLQARHEERKHAGAVALLDRVEKQLLVRGARRSKATRASAWLLVTTVGGVSQRIVHESPIGIDRQASIRGVLAMAEGLLAQHKIPARVS